MEKSEVSIAGLSWGPFSIRVDYEYKPSIRNFFATKSGEILLKKIEANRTYYNNLLKSVAEHKEKLRKIPLEQQTPTTPYWNQTWFPSFDGMLLYGLLSIYKPKRYIEVGSGNSTKFARRSIIDNSLSTQIISIDPQPREDVDSLCDRTIRSSIEELDMDELLSLIEPGDIFLIANSHRSFQGSDTTICMTEIIPSLPGGVIYGIHDIFIPFDYPEWFSNYFYNEQYLLLCYLLGGAANDEILLPTWYVSNMKELSSPLYEVLNTPELNTLSKGGSIFWMKKG